MKVARFARGEEIAFGVLDEEEAELVVLAGDPLFAGFQPTGERVPVESVRIVAPVLPRSKVVGVGRNYRDHAAELGNEVPTEPILFLKPNTSVIGPGESIVIPPESERVDHEAELAVVIGRIARRVPVERALDYVFGYTVGVDVTARDLQRRDGQWARAKGFDTFCPLGPVIETDVDLAEGAIELRVDGELRQSGRLGDMIFGVPEIVAYASAVWTLLPGDVILTGTPAGVGPIREGQTVETTIAGIGLLRNPVRSAEGSSAV